MVNALSRHPVRCGLPEGTPIRLTRVSHRGLGGVARWWDRYSVAMGGCASQPVHPSYVAAQEAELTRFRGTPASPGPTTEARAADAAWESPSGAVDGVNVGVMDDVDDDGVMPLTTTPVLSPVGPVTEAVFGGKKKDGATGQAEQGAASPPAAKAKPPKKLTIEEERQMLRVKLAECEELMIKGTEKALLMATMEESMEHLAKQLRTEQDARRVAELAIETERTLRRQVEDKVDLEVRLRQEVELRVKDANEIAKQAETLAWKARRAKELDELADVNKKSRATDPDRNNRLEVELAETKRLLNEERARARAERAVAETAAAALEDKPRMDADADKTRFEREVKEEVLLAMAKHEREMTVALSKAAEDKVNALEQAAVQKRQTIQQLEEFHKTELRRVEERATKLIESARTEMRPQRAEFEALVQKRLDDHKAFVEERKQALLLAREDYEANIQKLKLSHEAEVKGLREAAENLIATLKWEAEGEEGTKAQIIEDVGRQLRDTKEILDREAKLREAAEARSAADIEARRDAEKRARVAELRARDAEDRAYEAQRYVQAAERRTKQQYLEIERVRRAGEKRREIHLMESGTLPRPNTADQAVAALEDELGLVIDDEREKALADARLAVHDATAPYRAAVANLEEYLDSVDEENNRLNPRKKLDLEKAAEDQKRKLLAASETCARLLVDLEQAQNDVLEKTKGEREGLFSEREKRRREDARLEKERLEKEQAEETERTRIVAEQREREARQKRLAKLQAKNAKAAEGDAGSDSDSSSSSSSSDSDSDSDSDSSGDKENATKGRVASPVVESKGRWTRGGGGVNGEPPPPQVKTFQFSALEREKV